LQIPVYAIDFQLGKNKNLAQLFLGNNPWVCDCMFTPGFQVLILFANKSSLTYDTFYVSQDLLAQYQAVIKDAGEVKCAAREGDENSHEQVRKF
jgi:hypothetical protein